MPRPMDRRKHAQDRQVHLPKGSRTRRESKPQRRRDQQTHDMQEVLDTVQAKSKFPLSLNLPRLGRKWIRSAARKSTSPHMWSPLSCSIQCIANISRHLGGVGQEDGDRFCEIYIATLAYSRGRHHFYQAMCEKWDLMCYVFLKASQNSFSPWGQFQLHSLCLPIIFLILTFTLFPSTF